MKKWILVISSVLSVINNYGMFYNGRQLNQDEFVTVKQREREMGCASFILRAVHDARDDKQRREMTQDACNACQRILRDVSPRDTTYLSLGKELALMRKDQKSADHLQRCIAMKVNGGYDWTFMFAHDLYTNLRGPLVFIGSGAIAGLAVGWGFAKKRLAKE